MSDGPIRIPVTIYAVAFGSLNSLVSLVIKKPQIKITPNARMMLLAILTLPVRLSASSNLSIKDALVSLKNGNLHDSFLD